MQLDPQVQEVVNETNAIAAEAQATACTALREALGTA